MLEPLRPDPARELAPVLADPALHAFTGGQPADENALRARFTRQADGRSPDGAQGWLNWVAGDGATRAPVGLVQATISDDEGQRTAALAWVVSPLRRRPRRVGDLRISRQPRPQPGVDTDVVLEV